MSFRQMQNDNTLMVCIRTDMANENSARIFFTCEPQLSLMFIGEKNETISTQCNVNRSNYKVCKLPEKKIKDRDSNNSFYTMEMIMKN